MPDHPDRDRSVTPPLIVCAELDEPSRAPLDGLRRRHFPPERNHLAAHLTLFHHLEGPEPEVVAVLAAVSASTGALRAQLGPPRSLGRGVAIDVDCPELVELRRRLAARVPGELTAQDRQWNRPHVTVANKISPAAAKALLADLTAGWERRPATVEALSLWRYLGGPWEHAGTWALRSDA